MNRIRLKLNRITAMLLVFVMVAAGAIAGAGEKVYAKDSNGDIVIVIDPGHGGYDGGANAGSTGDNESDLNWNIAKYMKAELETYAGVRVYVTRANNEWNTNTARAHMGKSVGADFVISIHNNSSSTASTNGFVALMQPKICVSIWRATHRQRGLDFSATDTLQDLPEPIPQWIIILL